MGTRLALATALLVLLVAGGLLYTLTRFEEKEQLQAKRVAATMVATLFAELSSAPVMFSDSQGVSESLLFLRSNDEVLEAAVFAVGLDGEPAVALGVLPAKGSERSTLRAPQRSAVGTLQETLDALDVSRWVRNPAGKPIGAVVVRFSLARERHSLALLQRRALQISLGLAFGLTVLLLLLARVYIIRPLQSVQAAVRELSAGGHGSPIARGALPLTARDEIGDLARGFVSMAEAIERREAAIAQQNFQMRLVLGSVGEGFLVLDAHGTIEGQHSAVLETWFGAVPHGRTLWEYLRPHEPEQAEWLELTWANIGTPSMPLELCLVQMPRTFTAGERHYVIDYRPLTDARQQLEKMIVVISDVTELRRREQAESEQRELVAVFTALARDRTGFASLYEDAKLLISNISAPATDTSYDLLAHLHTIKGNAFLFRLRALGDACEQLEAQCADEQRLPNASDAATLAQALSSSVRPVESFIALDRGLVQMSSDDYDAIVSALQENQPAPQVLARVQRATAEPADVVFGRFSERLQVMARRLGKCPTRVAYDGRGVRFPRQLFAPLWAAMVHVLRNVADHGLETVGEREQAHKPPHSTVDISAKVEAAGLVLRVRDDGRGIDWNKVRERASQHGMACASRADLVAALLGHGFSTLAASSALSGRGVGLAALHYEVTSLGGAVRIDSELGQGTELTIQLPVALVLT